MRSKRFAAFSYYLLGSFLTLIIFSTCEERQSTENLPLEFEIYLTRNEILPRSVPNLIRITRNYPPDLVNTQPDVRENKDVKKALQLAGKLL